MENKFMYYKGRSFRFLNIFSSQPLHIAIRSVDLSIYHVIAYELFSVALITRNPNLKMMNKALCTRLPSTKTHCPNSGAPHSSHFAKTASALKSLPAAIANLNEPSNQAKDAS
uniref:Uncharacterized protein n=1 Tax=Meloidogyne incognita TaxID=6306 RepID=A0A914MEU7_MELIC